MTTSHIPDFESWLDMSRDSAHEGLYFLGPRQSRITFYTQQVRALQLVHALAGTSRLKSGEKIAVVGAGAAGVTSALAFAMAGAQVTLYDPAADILQLQSASPRLLHPHVYEWPAMGALDDQAGLPILDWTADTGGAVATQLTLEFNAACSRLSSRLRFAGGHTLEAVEPYGANWRLRFAGVDGPKSYAKVVLAMGFGREQVYAGAEPQAYWKGGGADLSGLEAEAGASCFVSGKGDGGLTELMALIISQFQHVAFAREFLSQFPGDALTRAADAAYAGLRVGEDLEPAFEREILPVLLEGDVLAWLGTRLRTDRTLTLNSPAPLFENGRAARLNQIMAYGILKASEAATAVTRLAGMVRDVLPVADGASILFEDDKPDPYPVRRAICRHGPGTDALYHMAKVQYDAHLTRAEATLAAKPELGPPLALHPATFDYFEDLKISGLGASPEAGTLTSASARRRSSVRLALDGASHRLSEQGPVPLSLAANRCDQGNPCEIHLAALPSQIPHAQDLVRLAAASSGRITLTADPVVHAAWSALDPKILAKPHPGPGYRPVAADLDGVGHAIDACLLRLLDDKLSAVFASGKHARLGPISPDIVTPVEASWLLWRPHLESDPYLRARFLTWLNSVDPRGCTPWPGDYAVTPDLVAALVLILATHLGQPLKPLAPDTATQGNLALGDSGAVAIGSGCLELDGDPIWMRNDPEDWGVDALILSGTAEVNMVGPYDRLMRGDGESLREARRVRPAMILNGPAWRTPLSLGLTEWLEAVEAEFAALKARQDKVLEMFK